MIRVRSPLATTVGLLAVSAWAVSAWAARPEAGPRAPAQPATPATKPGSTPAGLVGDWFWGNISPTRYWNVDTGEMVGHGYSGALSYVFERDGTYKRYFYLETRLYGDVSGIFSASEGTVTFTGNTFTLKPTKGTYRFTEGTKLKKERPMDQGELERPGLTFTWQMKKDEKGTPVLVVGKEGEEPRTFNRSKE